MSLEKNNISIDYGHLLLTDSSPLENITESKILNKLKLNYINFTNGLFQILKNQIYYFSLIDEYILDHN